MFRASPRDFIHHSGGAIAVVWGVSFATVLAVVGVAVTYATARHEQSAHQKALDAAVLAGASMSGDVTDLVRIAAAESMFAANLKASGLSTPDDPSISPENSGQRFSIQDQVITGRSSAEVKNLFSAFVGGETVEVAAESAARISGSAPVCVLALDAVSPQGLEVYGMAQFTAHNCAVQANSADGSGMRTYGSASARASQFGVQGNFSGSGFSPRPVTGVPPATDPYLALPVPPAGPCEDIAAKLLNTPAILTPGTYCGGIRIAAGSTIIMEPGVYLMQDGPFRIDSNSLVTGTEVVIAFTGIDSTLYLGSGAEINLTSPVSGPYANIQFFQDRESSTDLWVEMLGDIKLTFDGVMYFPTQDVWIGGGSAINAKSPSHIFVAEKLWIQDNSVVDVRQENSRGLDIAEPVGRITVNARIVK